MAFLDQQKIAFRCPGCGHELKETVGRLKLNPNIHCVGCGKTIEISSGELKKAVDGVDASIANLRKAFDGGGKRR